MDRGPTGLLVTLPQLFSLLLGCRLSDAPPAEHSTRVHDMLLIQPSSCWRQEEAADATIPGLR